MASSIPFSGLCSATGMFSGSGNVFEELEELLFVDVSFSVLIFSAYDELTSPRSSAIN